jgi:hypothetical protein
MYLEQIILNKLDLINHKKKFLNLKIYNEYKQHLLIKNVVLLYNENKSICYYFVEMYNMGYGIEILKYFFSNEIKLCFINYTAFKKYLKKFKIRFFIMFHEKIDFYNDLYSIIQYKDLNLIETFNFANFAN